MLSNEEVRQIILYEMSEHQNDKKRIILKKNNFESRCYASCVLRTGILRDRKKLPQVVEEELNKLIKEGIFMLDCDDNIYLAKYAPEASDFILYNNIIV